MHLRYSDRVEWLIGNGNRAIVIGIRAAMIAFLCEAHGPPNIKLCQIPILAVTPGNQSAAGRDSHVRKTALVEAGSQALMRRAKRRTRSLRQIVLRSSTVCAWTFSRIPQAGRHSSKQFADILRHLGNVTKRQEAATESASFVPTGGWSGGAHSSSSDQIPSGLRDPDEV